MDGAAGGLRCGKCGTVVSVPRSAPSAYHPIVPPPVFPDCQVNATRCPCCGAEIESGIRTASMNCPFCGAGLVFDDRQLRFAKPDGVAPVMISGNRVRRLVKEWCGRHFFAPDLTSKYLEVKFISPQYIPFWVFSASTATEYEGSGRRIRISTDPSKRIRHDDWSRVSGTRSDDLDNIGVRAVTGVKDDYAGFLFRTTPPDAITAWRPEYFAGSYSFIPSVAVTTAEARAKKDMKDEIRKRQEKELNRLYGYNDFSWKTFDVSYSGMAWRLEQIPGYFVICRYHGGIYVDAVNGVTCDIYGTYPVSLLKVTAAFIPAAIAAFAWFALTIPEMVSVCSQAEKICRFSWGVFGISAAIYAVIALIAYVCLLFWLKSRVFGRDDLQKNPWLAGIIGKIK